MRLIDNTLYALLIDLWTASKRLKLPLHGDAAGFLAVMDQLDSYEKAQQEQSHLSG